jgi:hypothetical protein
MTEKGTLEVLTNVSSPAANFKDQFAEGQVGGLSEVVDQKQ